MASKLVVLTRLYPPCGGGAELATELIIKKFLLKMFSEVLILTGCSRSILKKTVDNISIKYVKEFNGKKPEIFIKNIFNIRKIYDLIKRYDVVYIPSNSLIFLPYFLKRRGYDGRIIYHAHDYQIISYSSALIYDHEPIPYIDYLLEKIDYNNRLSALSVIPLSSLFKRLYKIEIEYIDSIITVSNRQKNLILKYMPEIVNKLEVIYNPIPDDLLSIASSGYYNKEGFILYAGGRKIIKGYHLLLKSIKIISNLKYDIRIKLVGITEKRNVLISKLGNVLIDVYPRLPRKHLYKLYTHSLASVIPSIHEEPLPYSLIESVVHGAIPVASRVGGIVELLENTPAYSFTFKPGNAVELADKLLRVSMLSPKEHKDIIEPTRERLLELFNDDRIYEQLRKIFE